MMVMPSNSSSSQVHFWAGRYPGRIGWLVGPSAMTKTRFRKWMPFALDNDAFAAFKSGTPWPDRPWVEMLETVKGSGYTPRWVLVPDVVADRAATLRAWERWSPVAAGYGWPLAFAVQNGMTPADVPPAAEVIFVGGVGDWKWQSLPEWCRTGRRIHVGRVNSVDRLLVCDRLGVESVDGTGWMRDTMEGIRMRELDAWLAGQITEHPDLFAK